jgi:hypothetical protein
MEPGPNGSAEHAGHIIDRIYSKSAKTAVQNRDLLV